MAWYAEIEALFLAITWNDEGSTGTRSQAASVVGPHGNIVLKLARTPCSARSSILHRKFLFHFRW